MLVDANAPLASHESEHIGMAGAESMNKSGERFERFVIRHELFAPTTMNSGQHTTYTHPKGAKLRRDFILVSHELFVMTQQTQILCSHDTTYAHEDHLPIESFARDGLSKLRALTRSGGALTK